MIETECGSAVLGVPRLIQDICYNEYKESWRFPARKKEESCGAQSYFSAQNNLLHMLSLFLFPARALLGHYATLLYMYLELPFIGAPPAQLND